MGSKAPGEGSTALSMTGCRLLGHRHSGKVMSAAQEPETEEEAQSGSPRHQKEGPMSDGQEGDGRGCWRAWNGGPGAQGDPGRAGWPLDTPPQPAVSAAPHGTGLRPGGDT